MGRDLLFWVTWTFSNELYGYIKGIVKGTVHDLVWLLPSPWRHSRISMLSGNQQCYSFFTEHPQGEVHIFQPEGPPPQGLCSPSGTRHGWGKAYGQRQAGQSLRELYHHHFPKHPDQGNWGKMSWAPRQFQDLGNRAVVSVKSSKGELATCLEC